MVRQEHAKVQVLVQQQQMELHQAQAQYAAYSAGSMGVCVDPLFSVIYLKLFDRVMRLLRHRLLLLHLLQEKGLRPLLPEHLLVMLPLLNMLQALQHLRIPKHTLLTGQ